LAAATSPRAPIVRDTVPERYASSGPDEHTVQRIGETLDVLRGKWKVHLLFLMARGVHRHGGLLACLPGASKKVMTDTLRSLECDGLVARRTFAEVPARVEYSLTHLGWTMAEPLIALSEWGEAHAQEVTEARLHVQSEGR
jgi:DNA-binding HxlR family transcriptional regulator